jgi:hypothetical protein
LRTITLTCRRCRFLVLSCKSTQHVFYNKCMREWHTRNEHGFSGKHSLTIITNCYRALYHVQYFDIRLTDFLLFFIPYLWLIVYYVHALTAPYDRPSPLPPTPPPKKNNKKKTQAILRLLVSRPCRPWWFCPPLNLLSTIFIK